MILEDSEYYYLSIYFLINLFSIYASVVFMFTVLDSYKLWPFRKPWHSIIIIGVSFIGAVDSYFYKFTDISFPNLHLVIVIFLYILFNPLFLRIYYKQTIKRSLLVGSLYIVIMVITDTLFIILFRLIGIDPLSSNNKDLLKLVVLLVQLNGALFFFVSASLVNSYRSSKKPLDKTSKNIQFSHTKLYTPRHKVTSYKFLILIVVLNSLYLFFTNSNGTNSGPHYFAAFSSIFFLILTILYILWSYRRQGKKEYQEQVDNEIHMLVEYAKNLDDLHKEIRYYKHDVENTLLSLKYLVDHKDIDALSNFYYNEVLKVSPLNTSCYVVLSSLVLLNDFTLKGLLLHKYEKANALDVDMSITVLDSITEIPVSPVDLSRIIGILLDNAIESSSQSETKKLMLQLGERDNSIFMSFKNTYRIKPDLSKMYSTSYTTKGNNRGNGLLSLMKLLKSLPQVTYTYKLEDDYFLQTLNIRNEA